jgi:transposase InsO family protein
VPDEASPPSETVVVYHTQLSAHGQGYPPASQRGTHPRRSCADGAVCARSALDHRGHGRTLPGRRQDRPQMAGPLPRPGLSWAPGPHQQASLMSLGYFPGEACPGTRSPSPPSLRRGPYRPPGWSCPSTVQAILAAEGVGRLDRGDRTSAPVRRYQRERPGELVHVDVKKLAAIPEGGGWRLHGRGGDRTNGHSRVGYRFLHSAVNDCTRLAYSEILDDEQTLTAAAFWARAAAFYADQGIQVERVITDNGSCYRSGHWHRACAATGTLVKKTRPRRPQTNGKVEPFHRILLEEWAYIRPWTSEAERSSSYAGFCHFYNHHRSHGSLGWATPHQAFLTRSARDNLPGIHPQLALCIRRWLLPGAVLPGRSAAGPDRRRRWSPPRSAGGRARAARGAARSGFAGPSPGPRRRCGAPPRR